MNRTTRALLVLIPTLTMVARGQEPREPRSPGGPTTTAPQWSELVGSLETMHAAMASVAPSGSSDVDFVSLMLPHHQAALDMAKTELLYGKDPQMRRLAQEIVTDQQSEMELMHRWLKRQERRR